MLLEDIPLRWLFGALAAMIVMSAFFSIAETAMMAINRFRLKYLASEGNAAAVRVQQMLKRTDRLLGGILIGNTLVIAAASTISSLVAVRLLGQDKLAYAIGTLVISFLIIVFSEITPKVIGATHPERTALLLSYPLTVSLRVLDPASWFVNLFVRPLLRLLRVRSDPGMDSHKLSPEEIRTLGAKGQSIVRRDFSIGRLAQRLATMTREMIDDPQPVH